ncbi:antibiotic biosynthesis monooxygenase family protein [Lysinibacillus sp. 54212]|uniref:antibiotic biosynthesis monooxygenase family protein n=1 Tax=Lysinibacillus sp. 54212 TaxID=3119829 RepID=UPI002FC92F80
MNLYLTSGTPEFMEKLTRKHQNETMFLLHGQGNSVALHESNKKSVFATPRKFEVIDGEGSFEQRGFWAFHNVPVMDESRPLFENRIEQAIAPLKSNDALIAYRVLRPIKSEIYIVITQWAGPASFEVWTKSESFTNGLAPLLDSSSSPTQNLFNAKTYLSTYTAPQPEA